MDRIKLSENFYLDEFQRSQTAERFGIDMSVVRGGIVFSNLQRLCTTVLQPVRDALGTVHISSGYRPPALNRRIGGASTSQHQYGQAADIVVSGHSTLEVARWIYANLDGYDQVIHEFGRWVHVSVADRTKAPRREPLTSVKMPRKIGKPRTVYVPGIMAIDDALRIARG